MAGKKRKVTKVKSRKKSACDLTLADIKQEAGPMGLLDPKLRKGTTGRVPTIKDIFG